MDVSSCAYSCVSPEMGFKGLKGLGDGERKGSRGEEGGRTFLLFSLSLWRKATPTTTNTTTTTTSIFGFLPIRKTTRQESIATTLVNYLGILSECNDTN